MTDPAPPNLRKFVAEDLSKPENRANVWLIAAMGVELFWIEFSKEIRSKGFKLNPECVMEPRQWPGRRPDLTVFLDEKPIAIIECENFGVNPRQKAEYGANCCGLPLLWVLGDGEWGANITYITWSRVKEIALAAKDRVHARQGVVLDLLVAAIDYASGLSPQSAMRWLDHLPSNPWLLEACQPLLLLQDDVVRAHAAAEGSASIRLLRPRGLIQAGRAGIVMAMIQAGRPNTVFLPSSERLEKHLDVSLAPWIAEWNEMLRDLVPGFVPDRRGLVTVPTNKFGAQKAPIVAGCFQRLISCLRVA